jgi:hypothetical protein
MEGSIEGRLLVNSAWGTSEIQPFATRPWNHRYRGFLKLEVHLSTNQARPQLGRQPYVGGDNQCFGDCRHLPGNSGIACANWCNPDN